MSDPDLGAGPHLVNFFTISSSSSSGFEVGLIVQRHCVYKPALGDDQPLSIDLLERYPPFIFTIPSSPLGFYCRTFVYIPCLGRILPILAMK